MGWEDHTFSPQHMRGYRLSIFTQLRQAIEAMQYPEEMFQWLTSVIMQRFDVPVVQLWTCENVWTGQPSAQLWAISSQDASRPLNVISEKLATTIESISRGQHITSPQSVERVFPSYLASLFKRYGLSYCASCFIDRNVDLATPENARPHERASTGLTFIVLLLLRLNPHQDLISAVTIILEQALALAENRHLLLSVAASSDDLAAPQEAFSQATPPALPGLILRRKQDAGLMLSSNPFASSVTISDKQALRLYEAVDGLRTVAELCSSIRMTLKEAQMAIQTLLNLQCIEVYTPEGWPVDVALLFKNH